MRILRLISITSGIFCLLFAGLLSIARLPEPQSVSMSFVSNRDGGWELYQMRRDGLAVNRLTHNTYRDYPPAWSPDGAYLAYVANAGRTHEIYIQHHNSLRTQKITNGISHAWNPLWTTDGEFIVFESERDGGTRRLYKIRPDGSDLQLLEDSPSTFAPMWSPDGQQVVYVSRPDRSVSRNLYITDMPSMSRCLLTGFCAIDETATQITSLTLPTNALYPSWSPDGERILYVSQRVLSIYNIESRIVTINPDGSDREQVYQDVFEITAAAWSGDGEWVAFSSLQDGVPNIYRININGEHIQKLTDDTSHDYAPAWQPVVDYPFSSWQLLLGGILLSGSGIILRFRGV